MEATAMGGSSGNETMSIFVPELLPCGQIPLPTTTTGNAYVASLSLFVQLFMLSIAFLVGHLLRRFKIIILHEAGVALGLGVLVGLLVNIVQQGNEFREWIKFNNNFFFYFLLPPIIFESGWSCETKRFFGNFGAICTFAFLGTFVSSMFVGSFLYFVGRLHWAHEMSFLVCLTFGALISSTDPVTVLAVYHELGVDGNLYAYVFGESVLNDAVAIVMYRTVVSFVVTKVDGRGIEEAIGFFIINFVGSFSIGVIVALFSALLLKHGRFEDESSIMLQACLLSLFPYMAYMVADSMELSGIVSILFAGITMKYYTAPHLTPKAKEVASNFFSMLAKLSEIFVFIYMGVAVFLEQQSWSDYGFALFTILSVLIGRILNIYPMSLIINAFRGANKRIPLKHQHALWFGGLRGAMAFALALKSVTELPGGHGRVFLTSTLMTVAFTVLAMGGLTTYFLEWLGIEFHVSHDTNDHHLDGSKVGSEEQLSAELAVQRKPLLKTRLQKLKEGASFEEIDRRFLQPIFANPVRRYTVDLHSPSDNKPANDMQTSKSTDRTAFEKLHTDENSPVVHRLSLVGDQEQGLMQEQGPILGQSAANPLIRDGSGLSKRTSGAASIL